VGERCAPTDDDESGGHSDGESEGEQRGGETTHDGQGTSAR
jgi:hypothetical protein